MTSLKRLLVGLDLSDMDKDMLEYAAMLVDTFSVEKVYFIHVVPSLELPEELIERYPDLGMPVDEAVELQIQKNIKSHFKPSRNPETDLVVREGNTTEELLKVTTVKLIDLVLLGKKVGLEGSGMNSTKVAKIAPCSVIFVPENSLKSMKKVLVPVDFSDYSAKALKMAVTLFGKNGCQVHAIYVYQVPSGYTKIGKSYEEFAKIMEENARKEWEKFQKKYELEEGAIKCQFSLSKNESVAYSAMEYARLSGMDLIIVGSKGRTRAASILLGSVAEKFWYVSEEIPVLIYKVKRENLGFLEALNKL